MENGKWKLETEKSETGNWKMETRKWAASWKPLKVGGSH
jgi:hypothetical protein